MSSAKHSFADISGIDWMISFIRWKSRILPSGGNNFSIIADVSDVFDYKKFEKKFHSLENTKTFLSGTIRRKFPDWTPRWYYGSGKGEGMVCEADKSSLEIEITGFLPKGVSLKAVFFEKKKKLLFTFSHAVFDGVGAEQFISFLLQPEIADEITPRRIPVDIPGMKENGREIRSFMKEMPEKKILRLPGAFLKGKNDFCTLTLPPEELSALEAAVEKKYGPFTLSLFILGVLLCNLEKHVFPEENKKEFVFIPMSVDLRNRKQGENTLFFNHWSLMPLLISRDILKKGVPEAVQHLRLLYAKSLTARTPQIFAAAADAMKYIPYGIIDLIVRFNPAKTLGTLMFSFLNSRLPGGGEIINLAHYPVMPCGNNLGFFVNLCNGNLNIVISRRAWQDERAFEVFCREIQKQLHEEIK